ncbi:nuclear transport factor 2 family protein [Streptomyces sp. NPDC014735]|uniref:nuclear transport factor 2 family protein n=1 Tax=unclassified Streptomyces TaxID=2593676 RepID=UPI00370346B1
MSTTRHLVNRRRRLAAVAAERGGAAAPPRGPAGPDAPRADPDRLPATEDTGAHGVPDDTDPDGTTTDTTTTDDASPDDTGADGTGTSEARRGRTSRENRGPGSGRMPRLRVGLPAALCTLTVLLGAFAAWAFGQAASLRDEPARQNTALTDIGRTSQVKGQIAEAVGAVFSYNYAATAKSEQAARTHLVGKAVQQHRDMLAQVRAQGPKQKLVLTTTVTDSGVEVLDGDRARLLIYADQSNTRTGTSQERTYAAAMFAVDAVRRDGTWRISAIDTFAQ